MSDKPTVQKPSPMRMLRAWLFRERAVRGPCAIELDVVERQVAAEEQQLRGALGEAGRIETILQRARTRLRAALIDRRSPGVIDAIESRALAGDLVRATVASHHHTKRLESLT